MQVALHLQPVQATLILNKVLAVCPYSTYHPMFLFWVKIHHLFIIAEASQFISIDKRFSTRLVTKMLWS